MSAAVHGEGPGELAWGRTAGGGGVRLWLVEGVYHLSVLTDKHTDCTVFGPDNPSGDWLAVLAVGGGGSSHIRIVLAGAEPLGHFIPLSCHFDVPYYTIQGTTLGPGDEPIEGLSVDARLLGEYDATFRGTTTSGDGSFEIEAPHGSYLLQFWAAVEGKRCEIGYAGLGGEHRFGSLTFAPPPIVIDEQAVTGIALRLPGTPAELCRVIEGRVSSMDGDPLPDVRVGVSGRGSLRARRAHEVTGRDGAFSFRGPDGSYSLTIRTQVGSACTITGTTNPERRPHGGIVVAGAGVTSIDLVVSGDPGPHGERVDCLYPPEVVTTELTPGWNLAGWTGPETGVRAVFEATPQLTALYSWDIATQSFREATRGASGIDGPPRDAHARDGPVGSYRGHGAGQLGKAVPDGKRSVLPRRGVERGELGRARWSRPRGHLRFAGS